MPAEPLISIITPNYNYSQYLPDLLESVILQGYANFEHIIVDDGSTDNSVVVIQTYIQRYPGKFILIQQENKGQTYAINAGLERAAGDIICWINSDDTFCEGSFSRVIQRYLEETNADIFFGDMNIIDIKGNFIFRRRHIRFSYISGSYLGFANILSSNAVFWKKQVMEKNGYPDVRLKCNMDGEFYSRLTQGATLSRIPFALANFRKQPYSKAAENNQQWGEIVRDEIRLELLNSYNRLKISKVLPFRYSFPIKFIYRVIRVIKRSFHLHFVFKYYEELQYSRRTT